MLTSSTCMNMQNPVVMKVYRAYNNILLDCAKFWLSSLADTVPCLSGGVILDIIARRIGTAHIPKHPTTIAEKNQITAYISYSYCSKHFKSSFKNLSLDFYRRSSSYMFNCQTLYSTYIQIYFCCCYSKQYEHGRA